MLPWTDRISRVPVSLVEGETTLPTCMMLRDAIDLSRWCSVIEMTRNTGCHTRWMGGGWDPLHRLSNSIVADLAHFFLCVSLFLLFLLRYVPLQRRNGAVQSSQSEGAFLCMPSPEMQSCPFMTIIFHDQKHIPVRMNRPPLDLRKNRHHCFS